MIYDQRYIIKIQADVQDPALLEVVHLLIERNLGHQFIRTGSSARKRRRQGINLLAGRARQKFMLPYMASELGKRFKLSTALRQGMLPVVWGANSNRASALEQIQHRHVEAREVTDIARNDGQIVH